MVFGLKANVWKGLGVLASAVAGAVVVGRKLIAQHVDRSTQMAIDQAGDIARAQIKTEAQHLAHQHLKALGFASAIKAILVAIVWVASIFSVIPQTWFRPLLLCLLGGFLIRDALVVLPVARLFALELKKHKWSARIALGEIVAAKAFEEVLVRAKDAPITSAQHLAMKLAGREREAVIQHIAQEVSHIARDTSWADVKPILLTTLVSTLLIISAYSFFVFMALNTSIVL